MLRLKVIADQEVKLLSGSGKSKNNSIVADVVNGNTSVSIADISTAISTDSASTLPKDAVISSSVRAVTDINTVESVSSDEIKEEKQTEIKNEDEKVVKEEMKTEDAVTDQMDLAEKTVIIDTKINDENIISNEEKEKDTVNQSAEIKEENTVEIQEQNEFEQKVESNEDEVKMDEVEAKEWRKYFISACRWFDTDQEKFLRADHLQLILQSADREVW